MKILTVVINLGLGGTQRAAQVFAEAYDELGNSSKILPLYGMGSRTQELSDNVEVFSGLDSIDKIREWSPDIMHFHSTGLKFEDVDLVIKNATNPECKFYETNVFSIPSPWASAMHMSFQLSTWANWIFQLRGGKNYASKIIPNPIRINSFSPASKKETMAFKREIGVPEHAFLIGRIGQAFPGKWSPLLIDIFNVIASENKDFYLLIVNAPENILDLVSASKFKVRIKYIPKIIGDAALSTAYSSMDAMVHIAEQGESFGIVLCECILCGTPVVGLSTPWNDNSQCQVIGHNKGGLIAHSKSGLIDSIKLIIERKAEINLNQRIEEIKNEFNHLATAKKVLDTFNDIKEPNPNASIKKILEHSIDRPNSLTRLLIYSNSDFLRKLTIFSSGYKSIITYVIKKIKASN